MAYPVRGIDVSNNNGYVNWEQWKHLVGTKFGIAGTFVQSGRYRHIGGNWLFSDMTAGPSSPLSYDHYNS